MASGGSRRIRRGPARALALACAARSGRDAALPSRALSLSTRGRGRRAGGRGSHESHRSTGRRHLHLRHSHRQRAGGELRGQVERSLEGRPPHCPVLLELVQPRLHARVLSAGRRRHRLLLSRAPAGGARRGHRGRSLAAQTIASRHGRRGAVAPRSWRDRGAQAALRDRHCAAADPLLARARRGFRDRRRNRPRGAHRARDFTATRARRARRSRRAGVRRRGRAGLARGPAATRAGCELARLERAPRSPLARRKHATWRARVPERRPRVLAQRLRRCATGARGTGFRGGRSLAGARCLPDQQRTRCRDLENLAAGARGPVPGRDHAILVRDLPRLHQSGEVRRHLPCGVRRARRPDLRGAARGRSTGGRRIVRRRPAVADERH